MKMSHTVTMRTTTTTTTSAIIINTGYFVTWSGILKLAESLVGATVLGLIGYYGSHTSSGSYYRGFTGAPEEALMFLVSFGCLLATFLMFLASLCSIMSSTILPKTLFELLYHLFAFIFYLSGSIALLTYVTELKSSYYRPPQYEGKMAAAILGLVNSVLYFLSLFFAFRSFRAG